MKKVLYLFVIIPLLSLANDKNSLSIGETLPIPNYKMKSVDGNFYSLNDLKTEEGILVIFTCNTCPFVVMWEDRYKMLEEYCIIISFCEPGEGTVAVLELHTS